MPNPVLMRRMMASAPTGYPLRHLRRALAMPAQTGKDVTLEYVDATNRYVWTPIRDLLWMRWTLAVLASGEWVTNASVVYSCIKGWSDRDASIAYAPLAWSQGNSAGALNGTWSYSKVAGRTATFTVTPGTDGKIYIVGAGETNGGIAYVTIDGGTTLVNELPLVGANRELDFYIAAGEEKNTRFLIASGLTVEPHTVVVTVSGTKNAGASDAYIWFEGYGITPTSIDDAQMVLQADRASVRTIGYSSSNSNEYAYSFKPTGAAAYEWTGSNHLNEVISAVTWEDETGTDISVSAGDTKNHGGNVVLEQTGTTRHSQTGATDHANVLCRHTFNLAGMDIYHSHSWLTAATVALAEWAMWRLVAAASTRAHIVGETDVIIDMTTNDDAYDGQKKQRLVALWNTDYPYVAWMYLPDLAGVNGWAQSVRNLSILDESAGAGAANKVYVERVGGTADQPNASIAIGDVWAGTTHYRVAYVATPETAIRWL